MAHLFSQMTHNYLSDNSSNHPQKSVPMNLVTTALCNTPTDTSEREAAAIYLRQARQSALSGNEWPCEPADRADDTVAVVGAGTMGCGIALCALAANCIVRLIDVNALALQRGTERIRASLNSAVQRGKLTPEARDARLHRLQPSTDWRSLSDADAVIEAVFENMAIKQQVMAQLHAHCPAHTLFISNTSTLDIDAMAEASGRPAQVLGMHFLTPAHITPLVEVIKGRATSANSLRRARALALRLGKLPVLTGNAWGFIGNRMFEGYLREVDALQLQGVAAERIDRALEQFGFALGPCRTLDMAGTDLVSQVLSERAKRFEQAPAYRRITRRLAELGRFGYKCGHGHYLYEDKQWRADPDLARVCAEEAARLGVAQQPDVSDVEIVQRCVQPLMEEGQRLLAEGLASRASDIDLVWVLGYGFPADRGGPMFMAAKPA
jgi:3-hydroxyacyl-CoA dehydrogenase